MGSESRNITVTRLIEARAPRVFAYLANPANHHALDTSGMIRGAADSHPITHVGQVFVINMHNAIKGDHQVANHVIAFEPDNIIGWAPAEPGHPPAGHTYTWRLRPVDEHHAIVTQTHDWSAFTHTDMLSHLPVVNKAQLQASLDKLATISNPSNRTQAPLPNAAAATTEPAHTCQNSASRQSASTGGTRITPTSISTRSPAATSRANTSNVSSSSRQSEHLGAPPAVSFCVRRVPSTADSSGYGRIRRTDVSGQ